MANTMCVCFGVFRGNGNVELVLARVCLLPVGRLMPLRDIFRG